MPLIVCEKENNIGLLLHSFGGGRPDFSRQRMPPPPFQMIAMLSCLVYRRRLPIDLLHPPKVNIVKINGHIVDINLGAPLGQRLTNCDLQEHHTIDN